ncbi:large-conductance mechanosensitive channel protein MscL [Legionella maioricensis]|uniref:Large-conductance mechanosensitive channel n=1 Tax=Legionella maioricensis TaxID=2896528 RepID=A0A9X2I8L1_9GAMM|nr:large-conductance mechanosensitive channel protein MscL [Legionella maioricensis]MCL9682505.1 large-conductance mechanosensitive channel protein MscL [Legionella maioricensis]MCL9686248.1 large-conductance mechanosensitive channel protein MscL [Legionella maioricensis]
MSFIKEFKEFVMRGNVVDLAVAVIIGAAFGKIITAFVDGIIMPLLGLLLGGVNIANKSFTLGDAVVKWGGFLQAIIDFTIIAFAIFVAIKFVNMLKRKDEERQEQTPILSHQEVLLMEIRDLLKGKSKPT